MENTLHIPGPAPAARSGPADGRTPRTKGARDVLEGLMHLVFLLCGIVAVGFVLCISVYLIISGVPAIREIGLTEFLFGKVWAPTNSTTGARFGILPFILTSVYGTAGAVVIGVPVGLPALRSWVGTACDRCLSHEDRCSYSCLTIGHYAPPHRILLL